jgi:molecular chaperone DnaK
MSDKIIGIDLGTTNSCVSVVQQGRPVVIPNSEGQRTTPSIVSFDQQGQRIVGQAAKRMAIKHPDRTIQSIKRRMGTNYRVTIDHMSFSPEQISAIILQKLKVQAQSFLNEKVTKAIVTVPAYFDDAQRLATRHAGQIAGLEVVRVINEPTASALAYGLNKLQQEANIIIFDFGGGTFDVTILQLAEQVLQVKATNGNNKLGGDDFDERIIQWLCTRFYQEHELDLSHNQLAWTRMKEAAEKAKVELSTVHHTDIQLPFMAYRAGDPLHLEATILREEFERMTEDLVRSTARPIEMALKDAKMSPDQINYVVLVGGTTRIPAVQQFIRRYFNREPAHSVNPDEAVAMGAAIQGGILTGEIHSVLLLDVLPLTLGLEGPGGRFEKIIDRNTIIPVAKKRIFTTAQEKQPSIHIHVVQGENERASENRSLARFSLSDIPPAAAGTPKVEVTFDVDVDGIFFCTSRLLPLGQPQSIELKRTSGLMREELEKLTKEHALTSELERKISAKVAATVRAESCIADAERMLSKYGARIPEANLVKVQAGINLLTETMTGTDPVAIDNIRVKLDALVLECTRAAAQPQA